ncbi:MAG: uroporphyrinogen-III synthase [Cyanobacteria bacterium]|nr:uroporphyrinogen-III synthase [Cyanobacteriota bacterium]
MDQHMNHEHFGQWADQRVILPVVFRSKPSLLEHLLIQRGARVQTLPLVLISPLLPPLPKLDEYSWIFFTSQEAVHRFFNLYSLTSKDGIHMPLPKIAVVGPGTQTAINSYGLPVAFVPQINRAKEAAQEFLSFIDFESQSHLGDPSHSPLKVLWPCGDLALPDLPLVFQQTVLTSILSVQLDPLILYQTTLLASETRPQVMVGDFILFTSPSLVQGWVKNWPDPPHLVTPEPVFLGALGPTTQQVVKNHWGRCEVVGSPYTPQGLVSALECFLTQRRF